MSCSGFSKHLVRLGAKAEGLGVSVPQSIVPAMLVERFPPRAITIARLEPESSSVIGYLPWPGLGGLFGLLPAGPGSGPL